MKIIKIKSCSECPNLEFKFVCNINEYETECAINEDIIFNNIDTLTEIHPDCPLEDYVIKANTEYYKENSGLTGVKP